jgi:hypothetical protein
MQLEESWEYSVAYAVPICADPAALFGLRDELCIAVLIFETYDSILPFLGNDPVHRFHGLFVLFWVNSRISVLVERCIEPLFSVGIKIPAAGIGTLMQRYFITNAASFVRALKRL